MSLGVSKSQLRLRTSRPFSVASSCVLIRKRSASASITVSISALVERPSRPNSVAHRQRTFADSGSPGVIE